MDAPVPATCSFPTKSDVVRYRYLLIRTNRMVVITLRPDRIVKLELCDPVVCKVERKAAFSDPPMAASVHGDSSCVYLERSV